MHKTNSKFITVIVIVLITIMIWNYPPRYPHSYHRYPLSYPRYLPSYPRYPRNYQIPKYQKNEILKESSHIPKKWLISTDPINWYKPENSDYYGIDGPTVYAENLHNNSTPDHDPLTN
jgi:hypothetical protein